MSVHHRRLTGRQDSLQRKRTRETGVSNPPANHFISLPENQAKIRVKPRKLVVCSHSRTKTTSSQSEGKSGDMGSRSDWQIFMCVCLEEKKALQTHNIPVSI